MTAAMVVLLLAGTVLAGILAGLFAIEGRYVLARLRARRRRTARKGMIV